MFWLAIGWFAMITLNIHVVVITNILEMESADTWISCFLFKATFYCLTPREMSFCSVYASRASNEPTSHSFSHACHPNPALLPHQTIVWQRFKMGCVSGIKTHAHACTSSPARLVAGTQTACAALRILSGPVLFINVLLKKLTINYCNFGQITSTAAL